jgi:hypothetical protein
VVIVIIHGVWMYIIAFQLSARHMDEKRNLIRWLSHGFINNIQDDHTYLHSRLEATFSTWIYGKDLLDLIFLKYITIFEVVKKIIAMGNPCHVYKS